MLENILNQFNNREYALLSIFIFLFFISLFSKDMREGFKGFFSIFLFQILFIVLSYNFIITYFLYNLGLWNIDFFKISMYWFFGTSIILMFKINDFNSGEITIKKLIFSFIGFTALFGFLLNIFTLSYFFEIILQLIILFSFIIVNTTSFYKNKKPEYELTEIFFSYILGIIFFGLIIFSLVNIISNYDKVLNLKNLYFFFYPIIYLIFFYPFLYIIRLGMSYETLFVRINIKNSSRIKDFLYVKYKIFNCCKFNLKKLIKFSVGRYFYMDKKEDINKIIFDFNNKSN